MIVDKLTRYVVTIGGITVLAAVVLIFLYLVWTVAPAFTPASVVHDASVHAAPREPKLFTFNETGDVFFRVSQDGIAEFYSTLTGEPMAAYDLGMEITMAHDVYPRPELIAVVDDRNNLSFIRTEYEVDLVDGKRSVKPGLYNAFSQQSLALGPSQKFDAILSEATLMIATSFERTARFIRYENVEPGYPLLNRAATTLPLKRKIKHIWLGARSQRAYTIDSNNRLQVWDIRDFSSIEELFRTQLVAEDQQITAAVPLLGRQSIMIADARGVITQWAAVRDALGFRMQPIRNFELDAVATNMLAEPRRKGLLITDEKGTIHLAYPASNTISESGYDPTGTVKSPGNIMALSLRGDRLLVAQDQARIAHFAIDNPHPEISFSALWTETWYEGYGEPEYIWQSSSADDDFEPKFSLTPLLFGSMKAAFFALLFALPLAIASAIYTAYFMAPAMRAWVKPGIEIMAALPTVILGFIGGLWLAPMMERNLSSVLTVIVITPLVVMALAVAWAALNTTLSQRMKGWYSLLVVPVVLFAVYISFVIGPVFEDAFFGGDSRTWLRDVAGMGYVQRNALVIGLMMGLAVIPTIFSIAEDAIYSVPPHLVNGSLALGATQWQTLTRVVLLTAGPGIFSAVMVGVGRAVGETMIVLMATGNTPILDFNIFEGMRTFAANIAIELPESEVNSSHFRILFLTALVLFIITFFLNTVAEVVRQRLRAHYGRL